MTARTLGVALLLLAAAPVSAHASNLSYDGPPDSRYATDYTFEGTDAPERLSVTRTATHVTFTDASGTLFAEPSLPDDCVVLSEHQVRCTTLPRYVALYGEGGDDVLVGSRGRERIYAGQGDDVLRPGLGIDEAYGNCIISCEDGGSDTLDFSQDGRSKGVRLNYNQGPDREESFEPGSFSAFIGTEHDDVVLMYQGSRSHSVSTLDGDDFVETSDNYAARAPADAVDCGPGRDLFDLDFTDSSVGCETPGRGAGKPAAGDLRMTYRTRYEGRRLIIEGFATCLKRGAACRLTVEVARLGKTRRRIAPGETRPLVHRMTRKEYARVRGADRAGREIRVTLSKPGFRDEVRRMSRNVAAP